MVRRGQHTPGAVARCANRRFEQRCLLAPRRIVGRRRREPGEVLRDCQGAGCSVARLRGGHHGHVEQAFGGRTAAAQSDLAKPTTVQLGDNRARLVVKRDIRGEGTHAGPFQPQPGLFASAPERRRQPYSFKAPRQKGGIIGCAVMLRQQREKALKSTVEQSRVQQVRGELVRDCAGVEMDERMIAAEQLDAGAIADELASYLLHPALLDGAFQGFLALLAQHDGAANDAAFLPWRFERVRLTAPFGRACKQARLWLKRAGVRSLTADIALYDEAGAIVAELKGCWFRQVGLGRRRSATERLFHVAMVPAPQTRDAAARALAIAKNLARLATAPTDNPARREQAALLEAAIGAASYSAWRVLAAANHPFTLDGLAAMRRISPDALGLAECLLQSLERIGGATEDDGQWRIETPSNLPDPAEIWRLLLADAPDLVAELALLGEVFDDFSDLLARGPQPPQPAHSGLVRQLVQGSPASRAGIDLLTSLLRAV